MNERKLTIEALYKLEAQTGLVGRVTEYGSLGLSGSENALISFDDLKVKLFAELRVLATELDIRTVIKQLTSTADDHDKILIADYINEELGDQLRGVKVNYLDKVGNAYLNISSVYVLIQGKEPKDRFALDKTSRLFTETGLKVIFALLTNHDLLNANYRTIADCANVSMGTIGWVLRELRNQEFTTEKARVNYWSNREKLVKKWVEEYPVLKDKSQVGNFYTQDITCLKTINIEKYDGVLGGELAVESYDQGLKPKVATIYVGKRMQANLIRDLKLVKEQDLQEGVIANVEIRRKFWGHVDENVELSDLTHPLITHADLMDTWDPTNRKVAELYLRDHYLNGNFVDSSDDQHRNSVVAA